jgi:hypothetical protein
MLTDREGLLRSATLLALVAVHGTDNEVAFVTNLAIGKDSLCDTLEILEPMYDVEDVAAAAKLCAESLKHVLDPNEPE